MRVNQVCFFSIFVGIFVLGAVSLAAPPTWTISGVVATADGTGVEGIDVSGNNGAGSAVTAADGSYLIVVPNHWDGSVYPHKSGWIMAPTTRPYTNVVENLTGQNFTAWQPIISGTVTDRDGAPIEGVTVTADNDGGTAVTDANGYYEISVRYEWIGNLTASLAGYNFTSKAIWYLTADSPNRNFTGFQPKISGYVKKTDGTPIEGASVIASNVGKSDTTDASGYYEVFVPYGWFGTLLVELSDYRFSDKSFLNIRSDYINQNFVGFQPVISGSTGVAGVTVAASGGDSVISTPAYSISVPYGWSGTLSAELIGYHFSDSPKTYTTIIANLTDQNFTPYQPTISGFVRKEDGTGANGITVTADNGGGTTTTNASGYYQLTVPYNWSGEISPSNLRWQQIMPDKYSYTNVISDVTEQNFTGIYDPIIIVKADGTGYVPTIQAAIDIAVDGDIVQAEDGTYTGNGNRDINFLGKAITVRGNIADPNLVVINCQGTEAERHRGFKFSSGEGSDSILEGFTITNGFGTDEDLYDGKNFRGIFGAGGGIYCYNSSPSVLSCIIQNHLGKGVFCYGGSPTIENCTISNNQTGLGMLSSSLLLLNCKIKDNSPYSGLILELSNIVIQRCSIVDNSSMSKGGGVYCSSTILIENSVISNNTATGYGGGIYLQQSNLTMNNCVISGNSSNDCGGAIYCYVANYPIFHNCTINNNTSGSYGGALHLSSVFSPSIRNCIIANNSAGGFRVYDPRGSADFKNCTVINNDLYGISSGYNLNIQNSIIWGNSPEQIIYNSLYDFYVSYSDVQGGFSGTGNINLNPTFEIDSIHLSSSSPCINAGDPDYIPDVNEMDIEGNPRVVGERIDMGASEYFSDEPTFAFTNTEIDFTVLEARDNPPSQNITFHNLGLQDLNWTASVDVDWLTVTPTGGSIDYDQSASITIIADVNDLPAGHYSGHVTFTDSQATNDPIVIAVTATIIGPSLGISQNNYSFMASKQTLNPSPQFLTLSNLAGGTLLWDIVPDCNWIAIEPSSGAITTESQDIVIDIDQSNVDYGTHNCQLTVEASNATNSPQIVSVNLDVLRPEIAVNKTNFYFYANGKMDGDVSPQDMIITNSGYDMLDWQIEILADCNWLSVTPLSGQAGGDPNIVTLFVDPNHAPEYGYNYCTLLVTDENASNNPQTVEVRLSVYGPNIQISPYDLNIFAEENETAQGSFFVTNAGYDILDWTLEAPADCNWITSITPLSGSCGHDESIEITVAVDAKGFSIGQYETSVVFNPVQMGNPVQYPVTLRVYERNEIHVPLDYPTLQQAVDAAGVFGDTIIVHPGTHAGCNTLYKSLSIKSIQPERPEIVEATIIGSPILSGYYEKESSDYLQIEGLSIIYDPNMSQPYYPVGLMATSKDVYISNCIIKNWSWGGVAISSGYHLFVPQEVLIENCLIAENFGWGISYYSSYPSYWQPQSFLHINNCTIADTIENANGQNYGLYISSREGNAGSVFISNSILSNTELPDDIEIYCQNAPSETNMDLSISHTCIPAGPNSIAITYPESVDLTYGPNNIETEPAFALRAYLDDNGTPDDDSDDIWFEGDYHLKSEVGRFVWDGFARADFNFDKQVDLVDFSELAQNWGLAGTSYLQIPCNLYYDGVIDLNDFALFCNDYLQPRVFGAWVVDDVTSPCIDAGDPNDTGWQGELWPHGGRVNMGAYGGTAQASMSPNDIGNPADLNHDDFVDLADWSLWADDWMAERVLLDSDFDRDNDVDPNDLDTFINNWLWGLD